MNRWAAARGVPTFTHLRFNTQLEPQSAFEAFQEALAVSASTGAHLHLCHVNSMAGGWRSACWRTSPRRKTKGFA